MASARDGAQRPGGADVPGPAELVRLDDAAARLGHHRSYVLRLVAARRITFYRVGGLLLFDVRDLDAHLLECRVARRDQ